MTSKNLKPDGFILPTVIDPPERVCITIEVPNDFWHLQAFWNSIYNLTYWYSWQRDDLKQGKDVAEVWKAVYEQARLDNPFDGGSCDMLEDVRQNEESPCTLEKTLDGITWTPWANLRLCAGKLSRFNPSTGVYETSTDGGETWEPDPENNPLNQGTYRRPPLTGENAKCDAAANARAYLEDLVNQVKAGVDALASITFVIGSVTTLIAVATAGAAFPAAAVIDVTSALFYAGSSALSLAFDSAFYEDMQCIFYCQSNEDGQYDATQWQAVIDDLNAIGGLAGGSMAIAVQIAGADGLSNMGTVGAGGGDCSECDCEGEWCYTFDFLTSNGGWTQEGTYTATYYSGEGWGAVDDLGTGNVDYSARHAGIEIDFGSSAYVTSMHFELSEGGNAQNAWWHPPAGTFDTPIAIIANPQGITIDATMDGIAILIDRPNPNSMTSRIVGITLRGTGANPFGEDNC